MFCVVVLVVQPFASTTFKFVTPANTVIVWSKAPGGFPLTLYGAVPPEMFIVTVVVPPKHRIGLFGASGPVALRVPGWVITRAGSSTITQAGLAASRICTL
jgi:hypothetical protein